VLLPYGRFFDSVVQKACINAAAVQVLKACPKLWFEKTVAYSIKTGWRHGRESKSVCQTGLIKRRKPIALFCINAELDN
jgi:predicted transcriptional regulator YheO